MSNHHFNPAVAKCVGVNAAVLYSNIQHWVAKNEANNKHEHEGRYWTYNSMKAFSSLFDYLSEKQIRAALDKLLDGGYIGKGNFNQIGYDRTLWYCDLMRINPSDSPSAQKGKSICPKGQMETPKRANRIAQKGEPIPDSKPDNKPNDIKGVIQKAIQELDKLNIPPSKRNPLNDRRELASKINGGEDPKVIIGGIRDLYADLAKQKTEDQFKPSLAKAIREQRYLPYISAVKELNYAERRKRNAETKVARSKL